ncbi:MAG TPA: ABC transporter permease [Blastocatellia bacterium]|nr:ABC transporter permease [Blastocatellia bacterium]
MDSLVIENVRHRPLRTLISVTGVALGVVLTVLTVGLAHGMLRNTAERQANVLAEIMFYPEGDISPATGQALTLDTIYGRAIKEGTSRIQAVAGVAAVSPVAQYLQTSQTGVGFEILEGVDFDSYQKVTEMRVVSGRVPVGEEVVVDARYAHDKKDIDGKPIVVGSKILLFGRPIPIVGIYEPEIGSRVKLPLDTMQRYVVNGAEKCSFLLVKCKDSKDQELVAAELKSKYPNNRIVMTRDLPSLVSGSIGSLEVFLTVVVRLAAVISTLVILLAMYTTIIERTREIGVLRSLGASKAFIVVAIVKEALLISSLGVVVGVLLSVAGRAGIQAATSLKVDIELRWILISAAISLVGGAVGALYPALRAAYVDPVKALSYE